VTEYRLPAVDDRIIWDIWLSAQRLPAMAVADELGLFDELARGPATSAELAQRLGYDARGVEVVLGMCAALKLLDHSEGAFALGESARLYLVRDSPYYWGPLLRSLGVVPKLHTELLRAVKPVKVKRTDRPVDSWAAGQMTRETAEMVSRVMHCHSLPAAVAAAQHERLATAKRVLDVGAGSGVFSIAIAQHRAELRCTAMDLPAVCDVARDYIARGGVADRVDAVAVDMFRDAWPAGHDVVFLSNVFHDWSPATNTAIARSAFAALPSGGAIMLHEMVVEDDAGPVTTAGFSLLMLTTTEGKQYTLAELGRMLLDAGFVDVRSTRTYGYYSVVTATKP
jgi:acetylserotonin N-methyltransferase